MKIVGSDYDGTLNQGGIGEEKLSAIKQWHTAGNLFGIVSGRGIDFRETLLQNIPQLELDFFVACNGAYITDGIGKLIYEARCNTLSVLTLAKDLLAWGCKFILVNGKQYICLVAKTKDLPYPLPENQVYLIEKIPPIEYFNQLSVQLLSAEVASIVVEKIRKKYNKWLNPLQNGTCIDIVPLGVNKAQGLYRVIDFFGCTHNDMIVVGDNLNDADMIREFRSYAMKNAVAEIRNLANGIVSDVTELLKKEL